MKLRDLILILFISFYFSLIINAQKRIGVLGGLSLSSYTGSDFPKKYVPNIGIAAGFFIEEDITHPVSIVVEANIEQKGVKYQYDPRPLTEVKINSKLNYFSIPILIKTEFGRKLGYFAYIGPALSLLFSHSCTASAIENGHEIEWQPYFNYSFVKFDTGLAVGVGMVYKEIFFDLRYVHGAKNLYDGKNVPDIRNHMITVKMGFSLYKRKLSRCYQKRR